MSEKCVSPVQKTTYLGVVWDPTMMQACMSPAQIESILTSVKRVREARSLTVKQFQKLLGLMSAASNMIPFGLLHMRPLRWWLKTKGFSLRGNPLCMIKVTRLCLHALDMWRKPLVFVSGSGLGSSLSPCNASNGCISHWLGSGHEWPPCPRSVEWSPSHVAYSLPGDAGRVSRTQTLSTRLERSPCVGSSRYPVEAGAEADVESLGQEVDPFATRQTLHCPLWLSLTHPAPLGLDAMVQTWPRLCLYTFTRSLCSQEF